jgi:antirestriction protein
MEDTPKIYVGTYFKYNNGSLKGKWIDLDQVSTEEEFYKECGTLHSDEHDPEYMFQDYENFPKCFYGESSLDDRLWQWLELDEDDRKVVQAYLDEVDNSAEIESIKECYHGEYTSKSDYAEQFLKETGALSTLSEDLQRYFDFEAYARDLETNEDVNFVRLDYETLLVFNVF